jgi:hypothetical protein
MDEDHLMAAVRYVALNPVRARLAAKAQDWPWSSVAAHLAGEGDGVVSVRPVLERTESFRALIDGDADDPAFGAFRAAETTGRPLGNAAFITGLERVLGRPVARSPAERLAESQARAPTTSSHCFRKRGIVLLSPYSIRYSARIPHAPRLRRRCGRVPGLVGEQGRSRLETEAGRDLRGCKSYLF